MKKRHRQSPILQPHKPPQSEVSSWTGLFGLAGFFLAFSVVFLLQKDLHPVIQSIEMLGITGAIMTVFEAVRLKNFHKIVQNLKIHPGRSIHTGSVGYIFIRLIGAIITLAPFAIGYILLKEFMPQRYAPFLVGFLIIIPAVLMFFALYFLFTPAQKDIYWQLGMVVLRKQNIKNISGGLEHWRQWTLKAFFIPFMFGIVYGNITFLNIIIYNFSFELPRMFLLLHAIIFTIDTVFGTIGYIVSLRVIDSHIRSTQRSLFGWAVCLICYPPLLFVLFSFADYQDSITWDKWLGTAGFLVWGWAGAILLFEALYVWATIIFGLRFSNLTHRGIITNGPYRYFKHPAYFAKNISWWLIYFPFVPVISFSAAVINALQLLFVNYIYYLRAKTEERHLMEDKRYRAYVRWIDTHGILPELVHTLKKSKAGQIAIRIADPFLSRFSYAYKKHVPFKHLIRQLL